MPEARIPFPGFYESWYSQEFNTLLEREVEYIFNSDDFLFPEGTTEEEIAELLDECSKFSVYERYVTEAYAEAYNNWLCETLGFNVTLTYADMSSPREYNFETDRIFCKISREDVYAIYAHIGRKRLREQARKMFTSRDGFISHYSPSIDDWGTSCTWDHNQIYCLLNCLENDDTDFEIYLNLSEELYKSFQASIDWPLFTNELKYLNLEEGRDMLFPHPGIKNTAEYVAKYNELNHLKE